MKDPAVLFYTQDFLTGTMLMTYEQKGKYITLLCLQHQNGKLSEKDMMKICGEFDEDIWSKFQKNGDGNFYNKRMLIEAEKRSNFVKSRRKNLTHKEGHMDGHMSDHMENENENENIIEDKIENKETLKEQKLRLLNERKKVFALRVAEFKDKYPDEMLRKFFDYWSEMNKSGSQMRWEMERTWELGKRLVTWASRTKDFNTVRELISFDELTRRFNNGEKDMWDKYEPVKPGDKKTLWRKKL